MSLSTNPYTYTPQARQDDALLAAQLPSVITPTAVLGAINTSSTYAAAGGPTSYNDSGAERLATQLEARFIHHDDQDELLVALASDPETQEFASQRVSELMDLVREADRNGRLEAATTTKTTTNDGVGVLPTTPVQAARAPMEFDGSRLAEHVRTLRRTKSELESRYLDERRRTEDLERRLADRDAEIREMRDNLTAAEQARRAAESRPDETAAHLLEANERLRALALELESVKTEAAREAIARQEAEKAARDFPAQRAEQDANVLSLQAEMRQCRAELEGSTQSLKEAQTALWAAKQENESLHKSSMDQRITLSQNRDEFRELEALLEESERERLELKDRFVTVGFRVDQVLKSEEETKATCEREMTQMRAMLEEAFARERELVDVQGVLESRIESLKADVEYEKKKRKTIVKDERHRRATAASSLEQVEAECDQLKSSSMDLESQLTVCKNRLVELEQQNLAMNAKNAEMQEKLHREQNSKHKHVKNAERELDASWQMEMRRVGKEYEKKIHELELELVRQKTEAAAAESSMHDALLLAKREVAGMMTSAEETTKRKPQPAQPAAGDEGGADVDAA